MVDANGQLFMEYPWAEDGLDLWSAMRQYFADYVQLYYRSDEDVLQDSELQSWWQEVQVSHRKASTSSKHLKLHGPNPRRSIQASQGQTICHTRQTAHAWEKLIQWVTGCVNLS